MVSDGFWVQVGSLYGREGTVDRGDSGLGTARGKNGKKGAKRRGTGQEGADQAEYFPA